MQLIGFFSEKSQKSKDGTRNVPHLIPINNPAYYVHDIIGMIAYAVNSCRTGAKLIVHTAECQFDRWTGYFQLQRKCN